jgi:hypothetical protein
VLVVSPVTSAPVRVHLQAVLSKARTLLPVQPLADGPSNKDEAPALRIVETLFRASYQKETGAAPTDAQVRDALSLMRVEILGVDPGGDAEREAKTLLRDLVLADENQADAAWATLLQFCARMAENHGGADRACEHADAYAIQRRAGHKNISKRRIYNHTSDQQTRSNGLGSA